VGNVIFIILITLWAMLDFYVLFFMQKRDHKVKREKKSKFVIIFGIIIGMLTGPFFIEGAKETYMLPFITSRFIGLFVISIGLIVRVIAILQLGQHFSKDIDIFENKKVYQNGLYKYVRHPSYLGEIMIFLGVALVYNDLIASLIAFIVPTLAFIYRIEVEERFLLTYMQADYEAYQKKTKRLLPFIY
jgi:protein-S-isoprenylcysteine O-methyltransferase Ste14